MDLPPLVGQMRGDATDFVRAATQTITSARTMEANTTGSFAKAEGAQRKMSAAGVAAAREAELSSAKVVQAAKAAELAQVEAARSVEAAQKAEAAGAENAALLQARAHKNIADAEVARVQAAKAAEAQVVPGLAREGASARSTAKDFDVLAMASKGAALALKATALVAAAGLLGVAAAGHQMITAGVQYQDAGNTFQAVTRANAAQMAQMSQRAIDLGNDLSLPSTSAADAANAMTELAKGGLDVDQSMGAAKGTLQLAAAANVDAATAATINADALNTFHLKGDQAVHVADLLAGAANASSGEITDMAYSLQAAGSVFAEANIPIEATVALIAEMANNGIKGADAGTSLKTMLMRLENPTDTAATAMKALNLHLYDATGNTRNFRDVIADAQGPLSELTQAQRDQTLATIFGSDAVRAGSIILGGGTQAYDQMAAATNRAGAAAGVAAAKSQGLGGAWRGLQSQLETVSLQIFQEVSPALEQVTRDLSTDLPKAVDFGGRALDDLGDKVNAAGKIAKPMADEYVTNWQRAAKESKPDLARMGKDFSDLGSSMQGLVRSEAFASAVAAFTVILPAGMKPTIATLQLMTDQFRITSTALFGTVKVIWDVMHGDWKAAWKDAADTVKTESENIVRESRDGAELQKAIASATSDDVAREYERMKQQTLNATAGMKDDAINNATQTRIQLGIQARATGEEYSGGMADGLRATGHLVVDAAGAVTQDAVAKAHDAAAGSHEVGAFLAQGISIGIADNQGFINAAAAAATRNAVKEARLAAESGSPSRLSAREVGLPLAQGVAVGIMQGHGAVATAARGLVKPFMSGIGTPAMTARASVGFGSLATASTQVGTSAGAAPAGAGSRLSMEDTNELLGALYRLLDERLPRATFSNRAYGT